jgi:selenocysteine lyase/cysteine desulfurase
LEGWPNGLKWRSDFPVLDQQVNGRPLIYLDSAATTQRPTSVIDALVDFYRRDNANPGAALHELARRAHARYVPVFSFTMDAISPRALLQRLDALGIAIRAGDLAALPLLKRFGISVAARASCYFYTSTTEIDRLADALRDITAQATR